MNRFVSPSAGGASRASCRRARASAGVLLVGLMVGASACAPSGDPAEEARLEAGRLVFAEQAQPLCTTCHTLRHAGATAQVGPNLDVLKPDSQRVAAAVANGVGIMPAQAERLTPEQIGAVAHYVATVAGAAAEE